MTICKVLRKSHLISTKTTQKLFPSYITKQKIHNYAKLVYRINITNKQKMFQLLQAKQKVQCMLWLK